MKKNKRLYINRETIRSLTAELLVEVNGGAPNTFNFTCAPSCVCSASGCSGDLDCQTAFCTDGLGCK